MKKEKIEAYFGILIIICLFILVTYIVNKNLNYLQNSISDNYIGMLIYLMLVVIEIVLAPITLIPIIPLAGAIWGSFAAFLLTLTGWTIGSMIIFLLSRKIGLPLIKKTSSSKAIEKIRKFIPNKHLFWGVILLRIFLPIDIVSYGISLFTDIDFKKYSIATLIGYAPIIFILSYFGAIPMKYQIILGIFGIVCIIILLLLNKKLKSFFSKVFQ